MAIVNRRGKVFAISSATVGITVLVAAGLVLKDLILERWHIYQLEHGDEEEKRRAIERLADVGGEAAVVKLREQDIRASPWVVFRRGLPGQGGPARDPGLPTTRNSPDLSSETLDAIAEIRARIGWERHRAATVRYMKDPTADARARTWIAQLWIASITPDDVIPGRLRNGMIGRPAPGTPEYQEYLDDKPAAIAACIDTLSSDDRYARGGAAFALSLCGKEARHGLPAIRKALNDPDVFVREAAADALERIKGDEHPQR